MNTMHFVDSRNRLSKGDAALARFWRTVLRLLSALDKRITANLDFRARLMLHGDGGPPDARRHKE